MSEMVERVKQAIRPYLTNPSAAEWDQAARAAIGAMRDATENMLDAGLKKGRFMVTGGTIYSEHSADPPELDDAAPDEMWTAMVDAALDKPPTPLDSRPPFRLWGWRLGR